jgi:hypothetical protein
MSASRRLGDAFSLYDGAVALYNKNLGLVQDLQKQLNLDVIPSVPLPPIPDLAHTRDQAKQVSDNFQKLQDLLLPPTLSSRAAAYFFASSMVVSNAAVAGAGQPAGASASARHLAATAIFLLKKFQVPDAGLNLAAAKLWSQEPDNAFFAFLAAGRSRKVDDLIRAACPYDPQSTEPRYQWPGRDLSASTPADNPCTGTVFSWRILLYRG